MKPCRRLLLCILVAAAPLLAVAQQPAQRPAQQPAQPPKDLASLTGVVDDSLRGGPLVGALVTVAGTSRRATTDAHGGFRIDSIPPGQHSIVVTHPLLDTLALTVRSAPFTTAGGERLQVGVHTPSFDDVRENACPRGGLAAGPSILVGRVLQADSDEPAAGAAVSMVFRDLYTSNSPERVRSGRADATGQFAICGLPSRLAGNVQASLAGVTTADLPVRINNERMATALLSIGVPGAGRAVLRGKVRTKGGAPVDGAQVTVVGTTTVVTTGPDGSFTLSGLPSGTHEAVVRKIGLARTSQVVTLSSREPADVTIVVAEAQVLSTVKIVGKLDGGLTKIGFTGRRQVGQGWFLPPEEIEKRAPLQTTDVLRSMTGLRVVNGTNGRFLQATRGPSSTSDGCMNIFIDHARYEQINPGDVDAAIEPADLGAVEYYANPTTVPPEFTVAGEVCATLVIWSKTLLANQKP
jgi:hypothetical protein